MALGALSLLVGALLDFSAFLWRTNPGFRFARRAKSAFDGAHRMKTATIATSRFETLVSDLSELVKARLSFLVLLTTLVGFLMGWQGPMNYLLLAATLTGTALCACGAAALNQWWERDFDARMKRTQQRPLPAKRMHPSDALLFGLLFSLSGLAVLFIFTNIRAALLALITITIYLFVYTPMKRISSLNTLVGAIPGALPPLIGWVAAVGHYTLEGGLLFAILWFWQMPHFLAIAWMYREDYARSRFCHALQLRSRRIRYCTPGAALLRMPSHSQLDAGPIFLRLCLVFLWRAGLGHCLLRDGAPLSDPAQSRFGSNTLPGVDPLSSFAPRVTCGRTPMNEEQAQFLAHAISLALCRRPLCNGGRFDAVARSGDCTVTEDEERALRVIRFLLTRRP